MSDKAKQLLEKLVQEYDASGHNSFDSFFYLGFPQSVLIELENEGCIIAKNDIIGSIELTDIGYQEAKK